MYQYPIRFFMQLTQDVSTRKAFPQHADVGVFLTVHFV